MTGKTHQIIGISVGLGSYLATATPEYNPATFAAVLVISSLAALLPDLDRASADIWRQIPLGRVAGEVVDPFIAHRNFSHSLLGIVLFSLGARYLILLAPNYWGIDHQAVLFAFIVSFSSHLVADAITVQGIPLLFPIKKMLGFPPKPFEGVRIITGKWFENLVIFPLVNVFLLALVVQNYAIIRAILFQ